MTILKRDIQTSLDSRREDAVEQLRSDLDDYRKLERDLRRGKPNISEADLDRRYAELVGYSCGVNEALGPLAAEHRLDYKHISILKLNGRKLAAVA